MILWSYLKRSLKNLVLNMKNKSLFVILKCIDSYEYFENLCLICRSLYYLAGTDVSESIQSQLLFILSCIEKEKYSILHYNYEKIKKEFIL